MSHNLRGWFYPPPPKTVSFCEVKGCRDYMHHNNACGHFVCNDHEQKTYDDQCMACEQLLADPTTEKREDGCPKELVDGTCDFYGCEWCQHYWRDGKVFTCDCYKFGTGKKCCRGCVPIHEWNFHRDSKEERQKEIRRIIAARIHDWRKDK